MKEINNKLQPCKYICASCNNVIETLSTRGGEMSIDVCSNCHPFYIGNVSNTMLKGRAEKLASKFTEPTKKPTKKVSTKKPKDKKVIGGFETL